MNPTPENAIGAGVAVGAPIQDEGTRARITEGGIGRASPRDGRTQSASDSIEAASPASFLAA
jgi:hypothetical protein